MEIIKQFFFHMPSTILFGIGIVNQLGKEIRHFGYRRPLLVTDKNLTSIIERVNVILEKDNLEPIIFNEVVSEPTLEYVEDGTEVFKENECDLVIGLGGGSCIDAAKGIAVMATNPGKIEDYQGNDNLKVKSAPIYAIPTTAGTGSEISRTIVLTDNKRNVKFIINDRRHIPAIAFEDPELTFKLPAQMTAYSGVDALTHAIEGFIVNRPPNIGYGGESITDITGQNAIRLIASNLRRAWANPMDIEARYNMMLGQALAAMTFTNSGTGLVHGLARPLGAYFHVPHGLANAIMLPIGMQFTWPGSPEKFKIIAQLMGENVDDLSDDKAARKAVVAVNRLCKDLEIPNLKELGIDWEELKKVVKTMAEDGFESGTPKANPRRPTIDDMVSMYLKAYDC